MWQNTFVVAIGRGQQMTINLHQNGRELVSFCFIYLQQMEQNTGTSRPYSNTLSTFLEHVKQHLATIPPVTKFALYTPIIICILDRIVFPLLSLQFDISSFISLNAFSFQGA